MAWATEQVRKSCTILDGDWVRVHEVLYICAKLDKLTADLSFTLYHEANPQLEILTINDQSYLRIPDILTLLASLDGPWSHRLQQDKERKTTKRKQKRCKTAGCERQIQQGREGMCIAHYKETHGIPRKCSSYPPHSQTRCKAEDCNRQMQHSCEGMCIRHYKATHGIPGRKSYGNNKPRRCKVAGCDRYRKHECEGMCIRHYKETHGIPGRKSYVKTPHMPPRCKVVGCDRQIQHSCEGMCTGHYKESQGITGRKRKVEKCITAECGNSRRWGRQGLCQSCYDEKFPPTDAKEEEVEEPKTKKHKTHHHLEKKPVQDNNLPGVGVQVPENTTFKTKLKEERELEMDG